MTDAAPYRFTVFTKPWKIEIEPLGEKVAALGFDGIELPVRPGYPVNPENVATELPKAAKLLRERYGLVIESIAGPTDEATIAACGEAGVPVIRICPSLPPGETYPVAEARYQWEWEGLVPLLDKHGVTLGIQNHSGRFVPVHAYGLARLLAPFDPKHVAAVWDSAHNALEGEQTNIALDLICGPHLRMVNLKNGLRQRTGEDARGAATWRTQWVAGKEGLCRWPDVAHGLKERGWNGVICLTAEYSDPDAVDRLIAEDIAFARSLFGSTGA
jgi:sugar phosphate isomerase/epimerase